MMSVGAAVGHTWRCTGAYPWGPDMWLWRGMAEHNMSRTGRRGGVYNNQHMVQKPTTDLWSLPQSEAHPQTLPESSPTQPPTITQVTSAHPGVSSKNPVRTM